MSVIAAVVLITLVAPIQYAHADPGWGTVWEYRMLIEIMDNSGSTLTNYQVPIILNTATFDYGKARTDGGDIRFGTTGGIDCDYWIEDWNTGGESTIWVEVPSIPASGTAGIYMYYGNPSAASTGSGAATFECFDDFADGNISNWSTYSSGTVQIADDGGNYVLLKTGSNDPNGGYLPFNNGAISGFEAVFQTKRINSNGGAQNRYGIESSSFNGYGPRMADFSTSSAFAIERRSGGSGSDLSSKTTSTYEWNAWMTVVFRVYSGNIEFELYDSSGALVESISTSDGSYNSFDRFVVHGGYEFYTDNIRVRKCVSDEPTVNLGQEETDNSIMDYFGGAAGISASSNIDVSNGDVKLGLSPIGQTAFSDSFESDLSNWDDYYTTSWYLATDRYHDGSRSVKASNGDEGDLMSDDIDLSAATSATIDFWFNKDDTEGTDFTLYFYDGSNWNLISELDTLGSDDVWLNYDDVSIDISTYGVSTFRIRFDATLGNSENVWIDQLTVTKTTEQYSNQGSLNSVSITPSNLQSWGTFSAADDNPTFCLSYRKPISITGTGTALTDYQVNVSVSYVAGMNSDFSDLRFKDSSGNILSYWIESYTASTSAQVWVKVPSIAASGTTTIYMYYGNAAASSASNESDVFDYVDRGNQASSWSLFGTGAGQSASDGNPAPSYYANSVNGNYLYRDIGLVPGRIVTFNVKTSGLGNLFFLVNSAGQGQMYRLDTRISPEHSGFANANSWTSWYAPSSGFQAAANQWYKFTIVTTSATSATLYYNQTTSSLPSDFGTLLGTYTITNNGGYIGLVGDALGSSYITYWDNIIVRKYASPEPIIGTGGEQSGSYCGFSNLNSVTSVTYYILDAGDDSVICTITAAQAAEGYDISSCAAPADSIKLRAELSTSDTSQTPILYEWTVTWSSVIPVSIEITAPGDISGWDLYPDISENVNIGTLSVDVTPADATWSVTAQDIDTANTNGFMTLWDGLSYNVSVKLATAMKVSGSTSEVTLPNIAGVPIATGTGDYPLMNITFKQLVTWDDEPGTYQIVVTFTGTVN